MLYSKDEKKYKNPCPNSKLAEMAPGKYSALVFCKASHNAFINVVPIKTSSLYTYFGPTLHNAASGILHMLSLQRPKCPGLLPFLPQTLLSGIMYETLQSKHLNSTGPTTIASPFTEMNEFKR